MYAQFGNLQALTLYISLEVSQLDPSVILDPPPDTPLYLNLITFAREGS